MNLSAQIEVKKSAPASNAAPSRSPRLALVLGGAGLALILATGLLLWAVQSESLFASYLVAALAGCF